MKKVSGGILGLALALGLSGLATQAHAQRVEATAVFAAGCFWCLESDMDKVKGVVSTTSGYAGGKLANPTYQQVSAGRTGHTEVVKVVYDPNIVTYKQLLHVFWRNVDPLTANAQFCDQGSQYRGAIFYGNAEEKKLAEESRAEIAGRFDKPIVTEIAPAATFYPAEDYHQDYYQKNPVKYKYYRYSCGRDRRLQELWGAEAGGHGS
ncbi:MAG: peptide-methionine (S)-S-oxide reductase MsrA [Beijerinckiaceae bacterium]|jgi:peptide-methionine (S)-S-oxide reductase|nr:peptide-methionine (S)-S-oxide reductase MsrA [Beijerinckiaceae bacterium]MDO9441639.1 peptide-methionine (S)-S-oxide reductase MsrA [Beijerinckiaceae bacterium]